MDSLSFQRSRRRRRDRGEVKIDVESEACNLLCSIEQSKDNVAERDVVLTYFLKVANEDLPGKLAFKGGTCLKKVCLGKTGRFSIDLDFTGVCCCIQ